MYVSITSVNYRSSPSLPAQVEEKLIDTDKPRPTWKMDIKTEVGVHYHLAHLFCKTATLNKNVVAMINNKYKKQRKTNTIKHQTLIFSISVLAACLALPMVAPKQP